MMKPRPHSKSSNLAPHRPNKPISGSKNRAVSCSKQPCKHNNHSLRSILAETLSLLTGKENILPNKNSPPGSSSSSIQDLLSIAKQIHKQVILKLKNCASMSIGVLKQYDSKKTEKMKTNHTQKSLNDISEMHIKLEASASPKNTNQQNNNNHSSSKKFLLPKVPTLKLQFTSDSNLNQAAYNNNISQTNLLNNTLPVDRSSILQYFQQKFGSPVHNGQRFQNRIRALEVIKKSQEISRQHSKSRDSPEYNPKTDKRQSLSKTRKNIVLTEKLHSNLRS